MARVTAIRCLLGLVVLSMLSVSGGLLAPRALVASQDDPECPRWRKAFREMPARTLVIQTAQGLRTQLPARAAAVDEARWAGLQCASVDEIRNTVVRFDFGREVLGAFHMQNVPAALDIAFVKASGRIFSILRMDPSPTATYGPMGAYRYAIEARAGFFKELGIAPGDSVQLERTK
jgi:uncharacterized membrane protein (UPF0127 family)